MRVVVDTNVLVSGVFWKGKSYQILEAWLHGDIELLVSPSILDEYVRVIGEIVTRYGRSELADGWATLLFEHARLVDAPGLFTGCRDPQDNMFIDCALAGSASVIITGDDDLLALDPVGSLRILSPADALSRLVPGGQTEAGQ